MVVVISGGSGGSLGVSGVKDGDRMIVICKSIVILLYCSKNSLARE